MKHVSTTSVICVLITVLFGCGDNAGVSVGSGQNIDPGRCLSTPEFDSLQVGQQETTVVGAAVSCSHVVWLAPIDVDGTLSEPQVHVHDIQSGLTYRTTAPAEANEPAPERWSPTLHGFWLAYAEEDRIVVENLINFERAEFEARPFEGKVVDIHYPWVVWQERADFGRTVVMAGHLADGWTVQVTPSDATATHVSVDMGRVVYTLWPDDLDGPRPTLDGAPSVQLFNLDVDAGGTPVHPVDAETWAGSVYGDTVSYLLRLDGEVYVVARSLSENREIGAVVGGIPDEAWPQLGAGVVTWLTSSAPANMYVAWWPELAHIDELSLESDATFLEIGEHLLVSDSPTDAALNVELVFPRETTVEPES